MKDIKREIALHSFYDRTGIANYLEKQASKGWLLDEMSDLVWRFKRIVPCDLRFAVTYFPGTSELEDKPAERELAFQDLCEHAGWKHAASNSQMKIFYTELDDPTPIDTDAAIEVEQIHSSMKRGLLRVNTLFIVAGVVELALFGMRMSTHPLGFLISNLSLAGVLCVIMMVIAGAADLMCYFRWLKKARTAAELDGSFVETKGPRGIWLSLTCLLLASASLLAPYVEGSTILGALAVALVVAVFAVILFQGESILRKLGVPAKTRFVTLLVAGAAFGVFTGTPIMHVIATEASNFEQTREPAEYYVHGEIVLAAYDDELPLKIEDLIETDYDDYSYQVRSVKSSAAVEQFDAIQSPRWDAIEEPYMEYTITEAKIPALTDTLKAITMESFVENYLSMPPSYEEPTEAVAIDPSAWQADAAYQIYLEGEPRMNFLLHYGNRIVNIGFPDEWILDDAQKATVGKKLSTCPIA